MLETEKEKSEPEVPQEGEQPGFIGRARASVSGITAKIAESERVQGAVEYVKKVGESERVRTGVEYVKETGKSIAESERLQKGVEYVKDTGVVAGQYVKDTGVVAGQYVKETGKAVVESERVQIGVEKLRETSKAVAKSETVQKSVDAVRETGKVVTEGGKVVAEGAHAAATTGYHAWQNGRGELRRVQEAIKTGAWRGSAKETLDLQRRTEWQKFLVKGSEEVTVSARKEYTSSYLVKKGWTIQWTFRVQNYDIAFALRQRMMADGGSVELDILKEKADSSETITGSWNAMEDSTIIVAFDNTYSLLRSKTVAFTVGVCGPEEEEEAAR